MTRRKAGRSTVGVALIRLAETNVNASAPIKGEGRFYKIGDNELVFMGYFQGTVEVEGQRGDLHGAGMVYPGLVEVTTPPARNGGRAAVSSRPRGASCSMPAGPAPGNRVRVWRALHHHRRHREVQ